VARLRLILCAALVLVCACAAAGAPPALGAKKHTHRATFCVKWARIQHVRGHTRGASFRGSHSPRRTWRCVKWRTRRRVASRHHPAARHPAPRRSSAADTAGGCADTDLTPSQSNVERVRAATLCLINRERAARGEGALQGNGRIEQAAQSHTESMAFGNYFEHTGPRGDTLESRLRASGYIYSSRIGYSIAENIAWGTFSQGTPRAIVAAWMASPGHRANILDAHYRDTAIGVSPHVPSSFGHGQPGGIYTQDFGVITVA
jgi:uncharacterized protein YkwD